jgi:hypothetical protein
MFLLVYSFRGTLLVVKKHFIKAAFGDPYMYGQTQTQQPPSVSSFYPSAPIPEARRSPPCRTTSGTTCLVIVSLFSRGISPFAVPYYPQDSVENLSHLLCI